MDVLHIHHYCLGAGNGWEAIKFCREHEDAAWDIFVFSLCGVLGQVCLSLGHPGAQQDAEPQGSVS